MNAPHTRGLSNVPFAFSYAFRLVMLGTPPTCNALSRSGLSSFGSAPLVIPLFPARIVHPLRISQYSRSPCERTISMNGRASTDMGSRCRIVKPETSACPMSIIRRRCSSASRRLAAGPPYLPALMSAGSAGHAVFSRIALPRATAAKFANTRHAASGAFLEAVNIGAVESSASVA